MKNTLFCVFFFVYNVLCMKFLKRILANYDTLSSQDRDVVAISVLVLYVLIIPALLSAFGHATVALIWALFPAIVIVLFCVTMISAHWLFSVVRVIKLLIKKDTV